MALSTHSKLSLYSKINAFMPTKPFKLVPLVLSFILIISSLPAWGFIQPPSTPQNPIDGGIGALLVAGGIIGYRVIKKRREM